MKEWVAVEVDSAHVIAVLFEGMPARSSVLSKKEVEVRDGHLNIFSKYSDAEARTTL